MIRIYGGNVTEGMQDGVEVGTEENPIVFDGMYPAFNGSVSLTKTFAIRTDGETVSNIAVYVAALDNNFVNTKFKIIINSSISSNYNIIKFSDYEIAIPRINNKNTLFQLIAFASGDENVSISPDYSIKLYIVAAKNVLKIPN